MIFFLWDFIFTTSKTRGKMFLFANDPEIAAIMGGMYTSGSHAGVACTLRQPYMSPSCDLRPKHPDDDIAFQLPRDTQDPRFEHWGGYVHGRFTAFHPAAPSSPCNGGQGGWAPSSYALPGWRV